MLREDLKKELDKLNDQQLKQIANLVNNLLELQSRQAILPAPFRQRAISVERAREFRQWVSQRPNNGSSLPNEAFSRETIYAE